MNTPHSLSLQTAAIAAARSRATSSTLPSGAGSSNCQRAPAASRASSDGCVAANAPDVLQQAATSVTTTLVIPLEFTMA
jgi:hypothetical protein